MQKIILLTFMVLVLVGCDAPQRTRIQRLGSVESNNLTNPTNNFGSNFGNPNGGGAPTLPTITDPASAVTQLPGLQSCDLSLKYSSVDTSSFGICQSSQDETTFLFKSGVTTTNIRTCIIPTYKDAAGSSTYLGQPQCTYTELGKVVQGKLIKNRSGFESFPINGVIVMREPLLPEYFNCMNAFTNWLQIACPSGPTSAYCSYWIPRCPSGAKTNALCDQEGKNFMSQVCSAFKSKYPNSYVDIKTKN